MSHKRLAIPVLAFIILKCAALEYGLRTERLDEVAVSKDRYHTYQHTEYGWAGPAGPKVLVRTVEFTHGDYIYEENVTKEVWQRIDKEGWKSDRWYARRVLGGLTGYQWSINLDRPVFLGIGEGKEN
jgi:hypothetical protein